MTVGANVSFVPLVVRRFRWAVVCPGSPELRDEVGRAGEAWEVWVSALVSVLCSEDAWKPQRSPHHPPCSQRALLGVLMTSAEAAGGTGPRGSVTETVYS